MPQKRYSLNYSVGFGGPKSAHQKGAEETLIGITAWDVEVQNQHAKNAEETLI